MTDDRPISRRDLLRGRLLGGFLRGLNDALADRLAPLTGGDASDSDPHLEEVRSKGPSPRYAKSFPVLRPPGAVEEEDFLAGCTRCNACVEACPYKAIVHAPLRFRRAAGTPMIDPSYQPCWMCPDTPCITSCEPGVLRHLDPGLRGGEITGQDKPLFPKMGVARIDETTCLPYQGAMCTVCSEQCPVEGAIEVTNGRPRIIEQPCTGCGVCQYVCPAPGNAILLMPLAERPPMPTDPNAECRVDVRP